MSGLAWIESRERAAKFRPGVRVEATAAAHERYYGLHGRVIHVRRMGDWQPERHHETAVLVDWFRDDALSPAKTRAYGAHKHYLEELKLETEEWDDDGKFPVPAPPPEPEPKQEALRI